MTFWAAVAAVAATFLAVAARRRSGRPERVVVDTNVFVAAGFNPGSASAELVGAVREGRIRMPWTDATRQEVRRILRRIPPLSWSEVSPLFREEDRIEGVPDEAGLEWIPDPADRKFAAVARDTNATLVSSDDDLLAGRARAGIAVVTPGEYGRSGRLPGPDENH